MKTKGKYLTNTELKLGKAKIEVKQRALTETQQTAYDMLIAYKPEFKDALDAADIIDLRDSHPPLHALYTKTAVRHLLILKGMISRLHEESNINLLVSIDSLDIERLNLIYHNMAYACAAEILEEVQDIRQELKAAKKQRREIMDIRFPMIALDAPVQPTPTLDSEAVAEYLRELNESNGQRGASAEYWKSAEGKRFSRDCATLRKAEKLLRGDK